jgi:hypothetical protein
MIYSETQLTESTDQIDERNVLSWPIDPYLGITAYFSDEDYKNDF